MTSIARIAAAVLGLTIAAREACAGDVAYGEYLAGECVTCHQPSGADDGIPAIVGWEENSFVAVMNSYRNKERENPVMQTIAGRLDDEMIASLAAYFATIKDKED